MGWLLSLCGDPCMGWVARHAGMQVCRLLLSRLPHRHGSQSRWSLVILPSGRQALDPFLTWSWCCCAESPCSIDSHLSAPSTCHLFTWHAFTQSLFYKTSASTPRIASILPIRHIFGSFYHLADNFTTFFLHYELLS